MALRIGLAVARSCFVVEALDIHSFVVEGSVDIHHTAVEAAFHIHMAVAARVVLVVDILRIAAVVEDSLRIRCSEEAGYILLGNRPDILDLDSQTSALTCDCWSSQIAIRKSGRAVGRWFLLKICSLQECILKVEGPRSKDEDLGYV